MHLNLNKSATVFASTFGPMSNSPACTISISEYLDDIRLERIKSHADCRVIHCPEAQPGRALLNGQKLILISLEQGNVPLNLCLEFVV